MLNQKRGYYHRLVFKSVVLFTQIASCVAYVHAWIAPYQKVLLAWGALLIVLELFRGFKPWKQLGTVLFSVFLIGYLGTVFLADRAYLNTNLHAFFYMVMMFMVFYAIDSGDRAQRAKEYAVLANVVILTVLAITVVGLVVAVTIKWGRHYVTEIGETGILGIWQRRFAGVVNANNGGALYAISILLSILMMHRKGRGRIPLNVFYVFVILIESAALILSYSRTSIYALVAALAVLVFWQLPGRIQPLARMKAPGKTAVRFVLAAAVAAALLMVVDPARSFLYEEMRQARKWYKKGAIAQVVSAADTDFLLAKATEAETTEAEEEEEQDLDDVMSGRLRIWKAALGSFKEDPVWGISNEAIEDTLSAREDMHIWHAHSIYITVLLAAGIVGAVLLSLFAGYELRILFRNRAFLWRTMAPTVFGPALLILFLLVRDTTETSLLFRFTFFACFYWEALGALRQELNEAGPQGEHPQKRLIRRQETDE